MSTDKDERSHDIYSISDIVRNCQLVTIIIGTPLLERGTRTISELLFQWGDRLWTFPEAVLAPLKQNILVYIRGQENDPLTLSRMELVDKIWSKDSLRVRQLIDHYDNTLALSRLELVIIALDCLMSRTAGGHASGDVSYALMGMLRQRPTVDKTDSAFQAFARLSLANDSDKLLERMICLLPKDQSKFKSNEQHYWATMDDHWDANPWDIDPACQIAGIGVSDTVIIDGAYGATIHWDAFQRVAITTKETSTRLISRLLLRAAPVYMFAAILSFSLGNTLVGVAFLIFAVAITFLSPMLILHIYGGKVWNTQPWLFGFEGHMPIEEIETKIFGFPHKRLTWTPYGSSLSQHRLYKTFLKDECRGIDPIKVKEVRELVERSVDADYGERRVFTLVDTNTM
jgi:hypothetical protein